LYLSTFNLTAIIVDGHASVLLNLDIGFYRITRHKHATKEINQIAILKQIDSWFGI